MLALRHPIVVIIQDKHRIDLGAVARVIWLAAGRTAEEEVCVL
jgi:hypothetical protein